MIYPIYPIYHCSYKLSISYILQYIQYRGHIPTNVSSYSSYSEDTEKLRRAAWNPWQKAVGLSVAIIKQTKSCLWVLMILWIWCRNNIYIYIYIYIYIIWTNRCFQHSLWQRGNQSTGISAARMCENVLKLQLIGHQMHWDAPLHATSTRLKWKLHSGIQVNCIKTDPSKDEL